MGNCPSTDDGHGHSERTIGGTSTRRDSWAAAFQAGGCHQTMLDELLFGERKFLTNMQTLVDVFHAPLVRWLEQQQDTDRAGTVCCPVSRTDVAFVFSNLDELVVFSRRLLLALERVRVARSRAMLVVFLQLATSFKVYDAFMAGWNKRVECLNRMEAIPPVAMFFRACELQERCGGLHLRDLLAMPLQRVAQYRVLVESTVDTCPPHLAVLHRELARTLNIPLATMHLAALDKSHESGRRSGATKAVNGPGYLPTSMATPRPKIKEGRLTKMCQDGPRSIRFVLYPDELFHASLEGVTGQAQQVPQNGRHRGVGSVSLGHCFVIDGFDAPLHSAFVVACAGSSFMVKATDVAEKNEWVAALKATMDGLLLGGPEPVSSTTMSSLSASGELTGQAISKKAAATATTDAVTLTKAAAAKTTQGVGVGAGGGKLRGSAKIGTTSWSSSDSSSSSSGGPAGSKADPVASGVVTAGQEATAPPPPSPPRTARLGKGRGQGKRKGIIGKRAVWGRQGTVGRLVYHKTSGRGAPSGARDHSGETGNNGGDSSSNGGGSGDCGGGGGGDSGSASAPGVVFPSDGDEGSGDARREDGCEEERESSSSSNSSTLEECSFWAPCGSGDKAMRWETLRLDSPSTEEVWSGSVGFRRALANPACLAEFRELLRTRHAIENLNFREAVASYRALCCHESSAAVGGGDGQHRGGGDARRAGAAAAAAAAQVIVDRFVRDGGTEQVNLSAAGREAILSRQAKSLAGVAVGAPPPMEMFTEAWVEVSGLLQRGTFMQFRNSETFLQLKKTWAQELNRVLGASEFVLVTDGAPRASEGLAMLALRSSALTSPSSTLAAAAAAATSFSASSSTSSSSSSIVAASSANTSTTSNASSSTSSSASYLRETRALGLARASLGVSTTTVFHTPKSTGNASSSANTDDIGRHDVIIPDVFLQGKATVRRARARKTPPLISAGRGSAFAGGREREATPQPRKVRDVSVPGPVAVKLTSAKTVPIGSSSNSGSSSSSSSNISSGDNSGSGRGRGRGSGSSSSSSGGTSLSRGRLTRSSPKVAKNCAMPPLPLAPSLKTNSTDGAPAAHSPMPESSTKKQTLAGPTASNVSPAASAAASAASAAAAATASAVAAAGAKRGRKAASVASSAITRAGGPAVTRSTAAAVLAAPAAATATGATAVAGAAAAAACQKCGRKTSKSVSITTQPPASDASLHGVSLEISTQRLLSVAESPFVSPPHPPPRLILHRRPSLRAASRTTQTPPAAIFRKKSTSKTPATKMVAKTVHQSVRSRITVTGAGKGQIVDDIEVVEGEASFSKSKDQLVAAPVSGCGAELRGDGRAVQGPNGGPQGPSGGPGGARDSRAMTVSAVRAAVARRARYNKVRLMLQAPPGTGLGMKLVNNKGMATVCAYRSSLDGNYDSALDAGLKVGDVLVSINGLHVLGNFDQAVQLTMRGQESGVLSLVVRRPHETPSGGLFEERRSVPPGRRVYRTLDYRL